MVDLISNSSNFIIKEGHKDIAIQGSRNTGFDGGVTLCQPGYSAEEKPGVVLIFFY